MSHLVETEFRGRTLTQRPTCPFCGTLIEKPKELNTRRPVEMPIGSCSCGAVYACDETGHNLGSAMIEALVFGCNMDWDLAWGLLPEEDYLEKLVENYDLESHLIVHGGVYGGRGISGVLYFIRLHQDVREVTGEGVERQMEMATAVSRGSSSRKKGRKPFSKKEVEALVREYRVEEILGLAKQDKRIIRDLQRLLYSVDRELRWRAADALGKACELIALNDPGSISRLLQGLFTSLTDTAASSWGSLDAIGEIIRNSPEQFAGYIPQLYHLSGDRALLSEVLRALGRIAEKRPDLIRKTAYQFIPLLQDPNSEIRGYAAKLLGNLDAHEAKEDLAKLANDPSALELYEAGTLEERTVSQIASEALCTL